jgi:hypothetical protein
MPSKHVLKVGSFAEKIPKPEWILYIYAKGRYIFLPKILSCKIF